MRQLFYLQHIESLRVFPSYTPVSSHRWVWLKPCDGVQTGDTWCLKGKLHVCTCRLRKDFIITIDLILNVCNINSRNILYVNLIYIVVKIGG